MADYSKMKVIELKAELKRLGLPQNGLKAELVSRLEEAAVSEDHPATTSEPHVQAETAVETAVETAAEPDEEYPSQDAEPANEESVPDPDPAPTDEKQDPPAEEPKEEPQGKSPESSTQGPPGNDDEAPSLPITEQIPTAEVVQDVQKRKRRSTTPPPSDEIVRKRPRQDAQDLPQGATVLNTNSGTDEKLDLESKDNDQQPLSYHDMENVQDNQRIEEEPQQDEKEPSNGTEPTNGIDVTKETDIEDNRIGSNNPGDGNEGDTEEDRVMANADTMDNERGSYSFTNEIPDEEMRDLKRSPSPEHDTEPSIHPATRALYIKNFMRPLRPQAIQEHLLELATPVDSPIDPSIIVNFYLDNIRTHAFAMFTSVSAASRVRTALHKRVWPDETNRKALWVDFIPPESFEDWVDTEQQAKEKGNMPRYEVVYDRDYDGNVVAKLEEADGTPPTRRAATSPIAHSERTVSIPTGPSRPSGIENAPTGPRNPFSHNGPAAMYSGRQDRLEAGFLRTTSGPSVTYRPVAPELAQRRLDILEQAKDQDYSEESVKEYHRYYFERDVVLVDRGPEIFLGIRPPHREKERRELARTGGVGTGTGTGTGTGVDPRDRFRDRRGPPTFPGGGSGGGGGRRRRRAPRPHGVPRGGDRFRPAGSSYDDRSDDRRPPRRDFGGGSRKDSYRR